MAKPSRHIEPEPARVLRLFGWEKVPGGYIPVTSDGVTVTRHASSAQPLEYALGTVKKLIVGAIG